jgi:hypothetical protein
MAESERELAWNLFSDLRKELVESQRIRTQIIGFKITFVSAAVGVISTNLDKVPTILLTVPAFAAIFFDFLIHGYAFSIRRIGYYCRKHLEPIFKKEFKLPEEFLLWEEFLVKEPYMRQTFAFSGNFGLTVLTCAVGLFGAVDNFQASSSLPILLILGILLALDVRAYRAPYRFT